MKLVAYDQPDVFEKLKSEWNELVQRCAAPTLFSTWEWQSSWWESYRPGRLWVVECRDESGRLVGIAPWFICAGSPERTVCGIGCIDVTDYVDVIVDQDCAEAVLNCLAAFLYDHRELFDRISLCNIPQESPTLHQFPNYLRQRGFSTQIEQIEVCPVIRLPEDWESYLNLLDKKDRHELRRKMRRLAGAAEEVEQYVVSQEHDIVHELRVFMQLMAASDPQKAAFMADPRNVAFFERVMPRLYEKGWLQLNMLKVGGLRVAAYLNFDFNGRVMVYNSGLLRDEFSHLSAGIVLLANIIQQAIGRGDKLFDFLRGSETYKYKFGAVDTGIFVLNARLKED